MTPRQAVKGGIGRCGAVAPTAFYRLLPTATALFLACSDVNGPAQRSTIVFDWLRDGNRDIYRATVDRADTLRLTTDPGDDQQPTVGGGLVVFTSYRDGNGELYSMPATGGAARRLTNTPENETEPALSADGAHLAYISDVSGVPKLWVAAPDGSGARRLTVSFGYPGSAEASPSWAPGGDRIVFVSTTNGTSDLFVVSGDGAAPAALVIGPSADVQPAWAPGGNEIAFVSDRDGDAELYLVSVPTGNITRLTARGDADGEPCWLADGRLVFTSWTDGVPRLRAMNPAAPARAIDVALHSGELHHAAGVF
ncbi:MAG: TolB family protein [Gemmatimonadetes bacterium]|nr:TolB family protein [Gemmatimonadota bacterium]